MSDERMLSNTLHERVTSDARRLRQIIDSILRLSMIDYML